MSNYLEDSNFGRVATSLLSQGKKSKRQQFVAGLLGGFLKGQQRKLKKDLNESYNNLKLEYDTIFTNNKNKYQLASQDRADYQNYLRNPEEYKRLKGIELFNADPSILASGKNFSDIGSLDPDSKAKAQNLYNKYQEEAEKEIKNLALSPEISMATYEQYNKAAMDSYKAKYAALSNDPAKQNLLNAAFAKLFPNMFAQERMEYEVAIDNAEAAKVAQNKLSVNYVKSPEELEKAENQDKLNVLNTVAQENNLQSFYTTEERLKLDKDALTSRFNEVDYKLTVDDLTEAAKLGVEVPGLPGFNELVGSERAILQKAFANAQIAQANNQNPLDVLQGREKDVYAIAIGTTVREYELGNMNFELAQLQLENARLPKTKPVVTFTQGENDVRNDKTRESTKVTIVDEVTKLFETGQLDNRFYDFKDLLENDLVTNAGQSAEGPFISGVIRTAQQLQNSYPEFQTREGAGRAFRQAVQIQLAGLKQSKEAGAFLPDIITQGREFIYEPVDSTWYSLLDKPDLTQQEAALFVYGLNNYGYATNIDPLFSKERNPLTDKFNEFITGPYRFFVADNKWQVELIQD